MASFRYKAVTAAGTVTSGLIDADSESDAIAQVRGLGHLPVSAAPAGPSRWRALLPTLETGKQSAATIAFATQELAALLGARLPLDRALAVLTELEETRRLRGPLSAALAAVRDGQNLADALDASDAFPRSYVAMVRAGEYGGNLEATLLRLADYLARANSVRETIISALIYPAILLCTSLLSVGFILVFVLPQFAPLFQEAGKALPAPTAFALALGGFLSDYWWLLLIGAALAFLAIQRAAKRPEVRRWRDRIVLRLPLVGDLVLKTEVERFARMLGTLLLNGVALPQGLLIARDTLSNSVVADAVGETAARLKEGEPLAARLRQTGVFPALALDLIRVGEESGALDEMLVKQAELYEHEVKQAVARLLALLVPALTVLMGLIVAGLIASILLAILSINELAS